MLKEVGRSWRIYDIEICEEEEFSEHALKISLIYIPSHFKRGAVFAQQKWRNVSNDRQLYKFMLAVSIVNQTEEKTTIFALNKINFIEEET